MINYADEDLATRLDLGDFLREFQNHLARPKPPALAGDLALHLRRINELATLPHPAPPPVKNLNFALAKLAKGGILPLDESYEFVKILRYLAALKKLGWEGELGAWLGGLVFIPGCEELAASFDEEGELAEAVDERLGRLRAAQRTLRGRVEEEFARLKRVLGELLIDHQIHLIQGQPTLLLRGSSKVRGRLIAKSSGGGLYILPSSAERVLASLEKIKVQKAQIEQEYAKKFSSFLAANLDFFALIDEAFDLFDHYQARVGLARAGDLEFLLPEGSAEVSGEGGGAEVSGGEAAGGAAAAGGESEFILADFSHPALKDPRPSTVALTGQALIITGVNAGGKSVLLKSILAAALLARLLLPMKINSSRSHIPYLPQLLPIIEDPQDVKSGLSTFAGRMRIFSRLLDQAGPGWLIGVDEIELGTDFEEAACLYFVLIQNLMASRARLIITTHHKKLALMLGQCEGVGLLAALYDEGAGRPKYDFLPGSLGRSYALESAGRYGIPGPLITQARELLGRGEVEGVINQQIALKNELEEKLAQATQLEAEAAARVASLARQREELGEKFSRRLGELERDFYLATKEAREAAREPKKLNQAHKIAQAARAKIASDEAEFAGSGDGGDGRGEGGGRSGGSGHSTRPLSVAEKRLQAWAGGANFAGTKAGSGSSGARSGGAKVGGGAAGGSGGSGSGSSGSGAPGSGGLASWERPRSARPSLDLHGLRAEEAVERLDIFISDALLAGLEEVIIYHGIGSGRLARVVGEFLAAHRSVREVSDAPAHRGGFGAKIVRL